MDGQATPQRIIVWFRRALRTDDNPALWHAVMERATVIPVLCLDESPVYRDLTPRRSFLRRAIASLDRSLRDAGTHLHVRSGDPVHELPAAARAYGARAVYAVELTEAPARERDARIEQALRALGVAFVRFPDRVLRPAEDVRTGTGAPFKVFTPYRRAWLMGADDCARPVDAPVRLAPVEPAAGSAILESYGWDLREAGMAAEAAGRLHAFLRQGIGQYADRRDLPGVDGTSRLSGYLAIGALSIRRVYWGARAVMRDAPAAARKGIETFISELIWREFYYQIAAQFSHVLTGSFRPEFISIPWSADRRAFQRWQEGRTGYPIVDAAMRQLQQEGWMHNRARMIVASFLTKDLHLNWQWGEEHFFRLLMDADRASNNGGWQWAAGTGTDASPWFRIFNPVLQSKKFDPHGDYIRRYVPELAGVPGAGIHAPWLLNRQEQEAAGCVVGRAYPAPIVDHAAAREKTLVLYRVADRPSTRGSRTRPLR